MLIFFKKKKKAFCSGGGQQSADSGDEMLQKEIGYRIHRDWEGTALHPQRLVNRPAGRDWFPRVLPEIFPSLTV